MSLDNIFLDRMGRQIRRKAYFKIFDKYMDYWDLDKYLKGT